MPFSASRDLENDMTIEIELPSSTINGDSSQQTLPNSINMLQTAKYLLGFPGTSGFGSKSTAEEVTQTAPNLRSITAIITGASSGIGAEIARVLVMRGARVVIPVRNVRAGKEMKDRITAEFPGAKIVVMYLDLSSIASVRTFALKFCELRLPVNILINNAGKYSHEFGLSEDGIEMTFATNYLGHFLLTKLLMKKMVETAKCSGIQGRIINVSSGIHAWFSGNPLHYLNLLTSKKIPYDATKAYSLSKLANLQHTVILSEKLKELGANVTANCVHPGIVRTKLTRDREGFLTDLAFFMASKLLKTIPQAAATACYVAVSPSVAGLTGRYFADCNLASPSKAAECRREAAELWSASEMMTAGMSDGEDAQVNYRGFDKMDSKLLNLTQCITQLEKEW